MSNGANAWKSFDAELQKIKSIALEKGYCDELFSRLRETRVGYATTTISLTLETSVRARKLQDDQQIWNVGQLWHPEPHQVQSFGRANTPYNPMLYCSDGILTAIREVDGKVGDRIAILEMELVKPDAVPHIFVIGELRHRHRTKKTMMGRDLDRVLQNLRSLGLDVERAIMVDSFYAEAFRQPDDSLYPLTVAITQDFLSPKQIDGIAYPTVACSSGMNLAIKPDSARRLFRARSAKIIHLTHSHGETFVARDELVSTQFAPDGKISWNKPVRTKNLTRDTSDTV